MLGMALAAALLAVLDQGTKCLVTLQLPLHEPHPVIPGVFAFTYHRNTGAAFSMLHNVPMGVQLLLNVAILVIFLMLLRPQLGSRLGAAAMTLIVGGAVGNIIDRLTRQYVVDFLDFHLIRDGISYRWPIFNLADIFIVVGVALMAILLVKTEFARPPAHEGTP